ncbi:hypothetical protein P3T40_007385 [Paraburkholderia sp. EB58]|jgi:hypothetical protein|uniref:hypothetical protein n=1 Tax=Paraburkholderia sp. EB58 TaxID=3035125 RepID=UPI003D200416
MGAELNRQMRALIDERGGRHGSRIFEMHHSVIPRIADMLYERGYKLGKPAGLKPKHLIVIVEIMIEQRLPIETMNLIWMEVGNWAAWIRKADMVQPLETYLKAYAESKAETANILDA